MKKDEIYMRMAETWALNSKAEKKKVGAILVKSGTIISDGYNGTISGFDNQCETLNEEGKLVTIPEVLHAESNAISKIARSTQSSEGSTMYVTLSPCFECSKLLIQAGIKRVVYQEKYRDTRGIELLKKVGIQVDQIEP